MLKAEVRVFDSERPEQFMTVVFDDELIKGLAEEEVEMGGGFAMTISALWNEIKDIPYEKWRIKNINLTLQDDELVIRAHVDGVEEVVMTD